MQSVPTVILAVLGVAVCDWVLVGRLAALATDFDYRYWPMTWPRVATLLLAIITASVSALVVEPRNMPAWLLLIWAVVFGLWAVVAVDEIGRQRALGYRAPPRYSEPGE